VKPTIAIALLLAALVLLLTSYMHDSAHRYDVVMAAAGSGGSQTDTGSTEAVAYLVDHKTGKVWMLRSGARVPLFLMSCLRGKETERGCEAAAEAAKEP
jgi:hypothetical protein